MPTTKIIRIIEYEDDHGHVFLRLNGTWFRHYGNSFEIESQIEDDLEREFKVWLVTEGIYEI